MSHRFQVVLADPAAERLRQLAVVTGQPPSTLAAEVIRDGLAHAAGDRGTTAPKSTPIPPLDAGDTARARWLEPCGGDPGWRIDTWKRVVALHRRYPRQLAHLKHGWWEEPAHVETLCALLTWRADLDGGGVDPREELAFQHQLADYGQALRAEGGGISKVWKPGAPPQSWLAGSAARAC